MKTNKKEDKNQCKTEASDDSSFKKRLKQKGSGLKVALDKCIAANNAETNYEVHEVGKAEENGLLDKMQLENLRMDGGNQLVNNSENSGIFKYNLK